MKIKWTTFRLKTWHFCLVLVVLFLITVVLECTGLKIAQSNSQSSGNLIELTKETFADSISTDLSFVLFYDEGSELCEEMERRIDNVAKEVNKDTKFYKIKIDQYDNRFEKYDISGVPSILIFKDRKEINRIMGLVSESNLNMIHDRIANN